VKYPTGVIDSSPKYFSCQLTEIRPITKRLPHPLPLAVFHSSTPSDSQRGGMSLSNMEKCNVLPSADISAVVLNALQLSAISA
jgi:hypothetical protein